MAVTRNTITGLDVLRKELSQVAATGLAFETEEPAPHIMCVAVPLIGHGTVLTAVCVATPVFRFTSDKRAVIIDLLQRVKPDLERIVVPAAGKGRAFGSGGRTVPA
jgi:DNA-binding IclR family transcriptional regulator